jgi:hypothetical protein
MVRRGRVLHEGRWVTKQWYNRYANLIDVHQAERTPKPRRPKPDSLRINDPDHIRFVRNILADILDGAPTCRNPAFRINVLAIFDELERIKRGETTPPNIRHEPTPAE